MKKFLFGFLFGLILGIFLTHQWMVGELELPGLGSNQAPPSDSENAQESILEGLNIDPERIREELSRTGRVLLEKASEQWSGPVSDTRIVATIRGKYVLDPELRRHPIHVSSEEGRVRLEGELPSPELMTKAILIALDTNGVREVEARLNTPRG